MAQTLLYDLLWICRNAAEQTAYDKSTRNQTMQSGHWNTRRRDDDDRRALSERLRGTQCRVHGPTPPPPRPHTVQCTALVVDEQVLSLWCRLASSIASSSTYSIRRRRRSSSSSSGDGVCLWKGRPRCAQHCLGMVASHLSGLSRNGVWLRAVPKLNSSVIVSRIEAIYDDLSVSVT